MSEPAESRSRPWKALGIAVFIAVVVAALWVFKRDSGSSEAASESSRRTFICSQTLKPFEHELKEGETIPILSPFSGKATGYPAELCYWTADGQSKPTPTVVLLNES